MRRDMVRVFRTAGDNDWPGLASTCCEYTRKYWCENQNPDGRAEVCMCYYRKSSWRVGVVHSETQYEGSHGRDEEGSGQRVDIGHDVVLLRSPDAAGCADAASVVF